MTRSNGGAGSAGGVARRDGWERHSNFIRPVAPRQRDERRHGQTHFALGAELGRDGVAAGLCFRSRHADALQRRGKILRY
jgi:hypothetical protein